MRPRHPEHGYRKHTLDALLDRLLELEDRQAASSEKMVDGIVQWAREDLNAPVHANVRSGTVWTNAAGRAKHRQTDDARIMEEIRQELIENRGLSGQEIAETLDLRREAQERAAVQAEAEAGDAVFNVLDGEVEAESLPVAIEPTPPEPKAAPKAKRDKLWWVAVMQDMAARFPRKAVGK